MFTDTHCHLYSEYYEDIGLIIDKSKENNVNRWINNGCDNKTNKEVIKLLNLNNNMYGAIGIHPENIDSYKDEDLSFIEKNVSNKKILAIGEIGLDYHYTKDKGYHCYSILIYGISQQDWHLTLHLLMDKLSNCFH